MNAEAFPKDIYAEPSPIDVKTLDNLGPLRRMAGVWRGETGLDVKPKAEGPKSQAYVERMELQPIDPVTNGPQLLYGLRYLTLITKPEQIKTYHEQVGYWLWEPATGTVMHTLSIPRGMTAMAGGKVDASADEFEIAARLGDPHWGIVSNPFLDHAFRTVEFRIRVSFQADGSWRYTESTMLRILGQEALFDHKDDNLLVRVDEPTPNPLAR